MSINTTLLRSHYERKEKNVDLLSGNSDFLCNYEIS